MPLPLKRKVRERFITDAVAAFSKKNSVDVISGNSSPLPVSDGNSSGSSSSVNLKAKKRNYCTESLDDEDGADLTRLSEKSHQPEKNSFESLKEKRRCSAVGNSRERRRPGDSAVLDVIGQNWSLYEADNSEGEKTVRRSDRRKTISGPSSGGRTGPGSSVSRRRSVPFKKKILKIIFLQFFCNKSYSFYLNLNFKCC